MVKFADSCLKIQPTLASYSVGIDILFFKKEKTRIHPFSGWKCVQSYIFEWIHALKKQAFNKFL